MKISLALARPNAPPVHATSTAIRLTKSWNYFVVLPRHSASGSGKRNLSPHIIPLSAGSCGEKSSSSAADVDRLTEMRCDSCSRRTSQFAVSGRGVCTDWRCTVTDRGSDTPLALLQVADVPQVRWKLCNQLGK